MDPSLTPSAAYGPWVHLGSRGQILITDSPLLSGPAAYKTTTLVSMAVKR